MKVAMSARDRGQWLALGSCTTPASEPTAWPGGVGQQAMRDKHNG